MSKPESDLGTSASNKKKTNPGKNKSSSSNTSSGGADDDGGGQAVVEFAVDRALSFDCQHTEETTSTSTASSSTVANTNPSWTSAWVTASAVQDMDQRQFLLDPLTVIIKLAIVSCKPVGTKVLIAQNKVYIQEPGLFQGIARYYWKSSKADLHYLHNPIYLATTQFLSSDYRQAHPRIDLLFARAVMGLQTLQDTYRNCTVLVHCLQHYASMIENPLQRQYDARLFHKDALTDLYTSAWVETSHSRWFDEKNMNILLGVIECIPVQNSATDQKYVKNLEVLVE